MIIFILFLAFILRLVNLNQSLWLDEAVQAITAQGSFSSIFSEIVGDFHPPLYHFLMHFWVRIFGSNEIALRMPSVLFGAGSVWMVCKISNLSNLRNLRHLSALLMATAPFHIYYSQEARMYSMACFFASLSMYFFIKINGLVLSEAERLTNYELRIKGLRINKIIAYYLISTLSLIYTDYYGFLVLLAQGIYLIIKRKYKFLILNTGFLILFYLPWLPMFVKQMQSGVLATQTLPEWGKLVNVSFLKAIPLTLIKFTIGRITIFNKLLYGGFAIAIFFLLGFLFYKVIISKLKTPASTAKRGEQNSKPYLKTQNPFLLIFLWFFMPLITAWLASLFVPNFQPFRLLLILPSFYLLITEGIETMNTRKLRIIFSGLFLAINLISLSTYYTNRYFWREDWRGLVGYFNQQEAPKVILPSSASSWPINYYDPDLKIKMIYGGKGINPINELTELRIKGLMDYENKNIFYIRYLVPLFDPQEIILSSLGKEGYTKISEISFNQISVWEFQLKD